VQKAERRQIRLLQFLEFLKLMAISMAQVMPLSQTHRCCLHSLFALDAFLLMQGLPIIQKMYPDHKLFREHPSLCSAGDVTADDVMYEKWKMWCQLQWDAFCGLCQHVKLTSSSGIHAAGTPRWIPPPTLCQVAVKLGAKWAQDDRTPEAKLNPGVALALKEATPAPKEVGTCRNLFVVCCAKCSVLYSHSSILFDVQLVPEEAQRQVLERLHKLFEDTEQCYMDAMVC
jgi:hypothetical protein